MAFLRKTDETTASTISTELVLCYALSKSVLFQLVFALLNDEVLGKRVDKQEAVLRADGAVALVGGVFMQRRG